MWPFKKKVRGEVVRPLFSHRIEKMPEPTRDIFVTEVTVPAPVPFMTRKEWIEAVARQLGKTMPDEFPDGFALYLAGQHASVGGYDDYLAGKFAPEHLWEPADA